MTLAYEIANSKLVEVVTGLMLMMGIVLATVEVEVEARFEAGVWTVFCC